MPEVDMAPILAAFPTLGLGVFTPVELHTEACEIVDCDSNCRSVFEAITAFAPVEGWLWGDARPVQIILAGAGLEPEGRIFAGQFVDKHGRSAEVRHIDGDRWIWTIMSEGGGEQLYAEDTARISTFFDPDRGQGRRAWQDQESLRYRRYWRIEAGAVSAIVAARFVGFAKLSEAGK